MLKKLFHVALCFVAVVATYWLYALLLVPLIEPSISRPTLAHGPGDVSLPGPRDILRKLFPPGSWQLQNPKVLENDQGMLLFGDYRPKEDGSVELTRVTLVIEAGKSNTSRWFIIEAPNAAIQFDGSMNLIRGKVGRLVGGRLDGDVTIRSPETQAGKQDDIEIATRNVQIDERSIFTPHNVSFRFGMNHGSGRDMRIVLNTPAAAGRKRRFAVGRAKSLELVQVERVHLQLPGRSFFGAKTANPAKEASARPTTPIEITCQGPFRFDFDSYVATLEDRVDVMRLNQDGPSDQLNCHLLAIHFATGGSSKDHPPRAAGLEGTAEVTGRPDLPKLEIERVVATGHPVILRAPSGDAAARGERLEVNFKKRTIQLEDSDKIMLRYRDREIEAPRMEYEWAEHPKQLGRLWATGPGRIRAAMPGMTANHIAGWEVVWDSAVRLQPDGAGHLLSLTEGARATIADQGTLAAREIHLWLLEQPQSKAEAVPARQATASAGLAGPASQDPPTDLRVLPDRMLASGQVRFESDQLRGTAERVEVWFRHVPALPAVSAVNPRPDRAPTPLFEPRDGERAESAPRRQFLVTGKLVQIELLVAEKRPLLENVSVSGDAHLEELASPTLGRSPLRVDGERFQVSNGTSTNPGLDVFGQPARVSVSSAELVATNLHILQGDDRVWVDGPGQLTLPMKRAGAADDLFSSADAVTVSWDKDMEFRGQLGYFRRSVAVHGRQQMNGGRQLTYVVRGSDLVVTLAQQLNFNSPSERENDLKQLKFSGDVHVQNQTTSSSGQQDSLEEMMIRNLVINQQTGQITADGPGWMSSVRYGNRSLVGQLSGKPGPASQSDRRLVFVRADFRHGLVGNTKNREVELYNDVRAIYGPVSTWEEKLDANQTNLGPDDVLLTCRRLTAREMGTRDAQSFELEAVDNVVAQGRLFATEGHRISYAEAKDLWVVSGDGRSNAVLTHRERIGAAPSRIEARAIRFSPSNHKFDMQDIQSVDLMGLRSSPFSSKPR